MTEQDPSAGKGLSRRKFVVGGAGAAAAVAGLGGAASAFARPGKSQGGAAGAATAAEAAQQDLAFVNGKIHTMDDQQRVVSAALIREGKFVEVGDRVAAQGGNVRVVNLKGRTVVPGLIETHTHYISLANRPGYHVADLELASSIAEVQALLAARRADVPEGKFITAMGGWHPRQWTEQRLPTLAELDEAVPDRPVFMLQTFSGPARTNSLGKAFFDELDAAPPAHPQAVPVGVAADGSIPAGIRTTTALFHLRSRQTFEDKKRSALDAMAFSAQVGVTALLDQVLFPTPGPLAPTQVLSNLDHYRMYDAWLALHLERKAFIRLQMNFLHNQNDINLPELKERLRNQFQLFGDDMLMTGAIGEWAAPGVGNASAVWVEAQRVVAQARWRNENSPGNLVALQNVVNAYEAMDAEFGIKDLRWKAHHVNQATPELLARLKALNCGLSVSGFRWLQGVGSNVGPPFRTIVDSGIRAAIHEDGVHIAPHNPWFALHYATTGLNVLGDQINEGQQITRQEALNGYTREAAWFLSLEDRLGSIEKGKLGDLLVLDRDYFTVGDADMRRTKPVLTVVGGKIVHDSGVL